MKEMIAKRRSVRAYRAERIGAELLKEIRGFMDGLEPLLPGARCEARLIDTDRARFLQKWRNPQFLAVFAEDGEDALINAGFMYQQLDLYLQAKGLGSCWVGLGWLNDEEQPPEGMKLAVMMALGYPDNVPERSGPEDFRRRAPEEIADEPDARLEPLRLAPSATNSQPWFVTHEGDALHLWREELGRIKQRTHGRMNPIDMGIALAHLKVAYPDTFAFFRAPQPPVRDGYVYVGSVRI